MILQKICNYWQLRANHAERLPRVECFVNESSCHYNEKSHLAVCEGKLFVDIIERDKKTFKAKMMLINFHHYHRAIF